MSEGLLHSCTIKGAPLKASLLAQLILPAPRPSSTPFRMPFLIQPGSLWYVAVFTFLFHAFLFYHKNQKTLALSATQNMRKIRTRGQSSISCYHLSSRKHRCIRLSQCACKLLQVRLWHCNGRSRPVLRNYSSDKPLWDHLQPTLPCLLSPDQALSWRSGMIYSSLRCVFDVINIPNPAFFVNR